MPDPLTAYEWLHVELSSVSGQLDEISRRLKHEPRDRTVRERERDVLAQQLDQISYLIVDCLAQAREQAYELYEVPRLKKRKRNRKGRKISR
jgi:hypothetical protein